MLDVIDAEAGGGVGRVVLDGLEPLRGASLADRARHLRNGRDDLRQAFCGPLTATVVTASTCSSRRRNGQGPTSA